MKRPRIEKKEVKEKILKKECAYEYLDYVIIRTQYSHDLSNYFYIWYKEKDRIKNLRSHWVEGEIGGSGELSEYNMHFDSLTDCITYIDKILIAVTK